MYLLCLLTKENIVCSPWFCIIAHSDGLDSDQVGGLREFSIAVQHCQQLESLDHQIGNLSR
jgi:hypothetical protein